MKGKNAGGHGIMDSLRRLEVWYHGRQAGYLAMTNDSLCTFEYTGDFLAHGFSLSPFELPLQKGVFVGKRHPFEGGFGVFDDALPDGWGLLILDRYLQSVGIKPSELNLLDRLALVGKSGRGALEFVPDKSVLPPTQIADMDMLALQAAALLEEKSYSGEDIVELYRRGGSPGGARPKVFVEADGNEWLVKFPAKNDPSDIGLTEYQYALLAQDCGVEMPEVRLFERKYFGVRRFDRVNGEKLHVVSMAGLLRADYRIPCIDYWHVFQVSSALSYDVNELWRVYKLMCFNYLIGNKDDHAKNFSFVCDEGKWRLSPAYDLLPSDGFGGCHTTSINDSITPQDADLVALAVKAGLEAKKACRVLDEMKRKVETAKFD